MTANPEPANAMTTPLVAAIPEPATVIAADLTPAAAWSGRARRIGRRQPVVIDRRYPSSKTCSTCRYLLAELSLSTSHPRRCR